MRTQWKCHKCCAFAVADIFTAIFCLSLQCSQYKLYNHFCKYRYNRQTTRRRRRRQREAEEAVAYVLHTARSWAQLRASPADKPQSEQIWCSQVMGGRPRDLRQFGKGGTPSRTSHATRRTALSGTLSGIRATSPNSERRRRRTIDWILCRPDLV